MKSKTGRTNNYIGNILQVTKDIIKQNKTFYNYYIHKDNELYKKQLPILIQKSNIHSIALRKKEKAIKNLKEELFPKPSISIDTSLLSLEKIRNMKIRSKNLPPLCPFYNKKGELLRQVVMTSKISHKKFFYEDYKSLSPKNIRLTKKLEFMKKEKLKNSLVINFDNFENDYFYEPEYSSLTYQEAQIFGKKEKYFEFIKNKINEFKISEIKNDEFKKEKIYENSLKKKSIKLSIDSIKITINEINGLSKEKKIENNPIFEYNFPFQYLFLFYYKGEEKFKIILSQIIKYDNKTNKFSIIENPQKIIKDILKYSLGYKEEKIEKPIIKEFKKRPSQSKDKLSQTIGLKRPIKKDSNPKLSIFNSSNAAKNLAQTLIANNINMYMTNSDNENKRKIDIISKSNVYPNKIDYDYINYNIFEFFWLTENKYFKVTIRTPLISFSIPKNRIIVKKFIDFELLFYLIENDFLNWDFYIIKYLSSFKAFRALLEEINSIHESFNKNFYLIEPKTKYYSFYNIELINIATIKKREISENILEPLIGISESKEEDKHIIENNLEKENNNINKEKEKDNVNINNNSEKGSEIIQEMFNSIFDQKCFMVSVRFLDTKTFKANEYRIHFNYNQYQKIQKMEKYIDKISFLIKFINIDEIKKIVSIDYKSLDNFDENKWIKNFNKYNTNYLETMANTNYATYSKQKTIVESQGIIKNSVIQIEIFNPILSVKMFSESGIISNEKKPLNNNYQEKIIKIEKDNILELSKLFYDCFEKEKNNINKNEEKIK